MKDKHLHISGIVLVACLPIIFWAIEIIANKYDISLHTIYRIHYEVPTLILVDIFAFVLAYFYKRLITEYYFKKEKFKIIVEEKEALINKNAEYALKIGKGDFSDSDNEVDEYDVLGTALNIMRTNLLNASQKDDYLNWLSKGKDKISIVLRENNDLKKLCADVLETIIKFADFAQGACYVYDEEKNTLINYATYAYNRKKFIQQEFKVGHGLIGQCAFEKTTIYRTEIPEDYVTIGSGILGDKKPGSILLVPLVTDDILYGVIELICIKDEIPHGNIVYVSELSDIIARTIFNLKVNQKTKALLDETQLMAEELKRNETLLNKNAESMRLAQENLKKVNENLENKIQEVERSQNRTQTLLENASEVISIIDENGIVLYESPSVQKILGYEADEVIGRNIFEDLGFNGMKQLQTSFETLIKKPWETIVCEFKYNKAGREEIWLESTGRNLSKNTSIGGILFNTRDITQRKLAEVEQRMRGQMQALSENSPDMILRLSLDGGIYYANAIFEKYTGLKLDENIKNTLYNVGVEQKTIGFFMGVIEYVKLQKTKHEVEFEFDTVRGERVFQINAIPEFDENTVLETVLMVAHDITHRKQAEDEIKDKNKKITESINYAYRIQSAILPDTNLLRQYLPDSFIFYRPKDVVSGDFPWLFRRGDNLFVAAVDCTGHGVPGALLSFIGYFTLNNIVDHERDITAGEVLDQLHNKVRQTLKQDQEDADTRDGMDIALCKINLAKGEIQYAGAHRSLYYISNGELTEYKGDRKAIGGTVYKKKKENNFTNYIINLQKNDKMFFFSDGFPDQVGGEDNKTKYSTKQLRDLTETHAEKSMDEFNAIVEKELYTWMGDNKQIDDILFFGIKI